MQLKHDDKISSRQLSISISSVIIAVGVVTMPRTAVKVVGTADVWITLLLSGAIAMMIVYLCTKLMQRYPGQTFFEYNQRIVGKALGMLISFFFSCYWLMLAAYEARMNAEVIRFLLLERTPIEVTILSFMLVALYIVIKGQNPLVRLAHLVFPLTTIVLLTILLLGINKFHGSNFLPVASEGVWPIVKGIPVTSILYLGFEAILILGASVQDISKLPRAGLVGVFIPIVIYVITFVLVIGILSPEEVMTLVWPTIEVIKDIEFPGAFFANFEIVFIVVWVVQIFTTYTMAYYLAGLGLSHFFHRKKDVFPYVLLPVVFLLAWYPADINEAIHLGDIISKMSYLTAGIIPVTLLIISCLREGWHGQKQI